MYSVASYGRMIRDIDRMSPYEKALQETIQPGNVILDIGAGTGIFSFLACQSGAGKVYAIEPDQAIQLAREIAIANNMSDKITFIQDLSTRIDLPEPVDVIVSDLRGVLPLFQHHIPSIVDARQRFLKPNGKLIPQRDRIWVAIVTSEELYEPYISPWIENPYDLDMRVSRQVVTNTWRKTRLKPDQLLCEAQIWTTLDYGTIRDSNASGSITWTAQKSGVGHGIGVWFDTQLIEGVTFSNSPDSPELIYGMAFFPWLDHVDIEAGDRITLELKANLIGNDYIWLWNTQILGKSFNNQQKANFKQSTFWGSPISPNNLMKRADWFKPSLNEEGQIDRLVLEFFGQGRSLGEIATKLSERFADRFPTWQEALAHVSDLSEKYAQ